MAAGQETPAATRAGLSHALVLLLLGASLPLLLVANPFPFFKDSGELSASLATSGIGHPTGFSLQHVVAALCRLVPMASVSWRLSMLSVLGALAAVGAGLAMNLSPAATGGRRFHFGQVLAAAAVWAGFLLCDTVYLHTVNVEVYLPSAGMSGLVLLAGWRCVAVPAGLPVDRRWWRMLWLLSGLSAGVHITAVGVAGICCLLATARLMVGGGRTPSNRPLVRGLLMQGLLLGLAGALIVAYLPVRASTGPVRNWGDPSQLGGFFAHVSGQSIRTAFAGTMLGGTLPAVLDRWVFYLESIVGQSPLLLPAAAFGLAVTWRMSRTGAVVCTACLGFDAFFSAMVNPMGQVEKQTGTLSLLVLSVVAGHGLVFLAGRGRGAVHNGGLSDSAPSDRQPAVALAANNGLQTTGHSSGRPYRLLGPVAAAVVGLALLLGAAHDLLPRFAVGEEQGRQGRTAGLAYDIGLLALRQAPPEALLATGSDDLSALALFLQEVEHRRPDLSHVVKQMACELTPGSLLVSSARVLDLPRRWSTLVGQHCSVPDMAVVASLWERARGILEEAQAPLVWELGDAVLDRIFEDLLVPGFPCFEARFGSDVVVADLPPPALDIPLGSGEGDEFAAAFLAQYERLSGAFLLRWQERYLPGQAVARGCRLIASAVRRAPSDCPSWNNLGVCRSTTGDLRGALLAVQQAVETCPDYLTGRMNLLRYSLLLGEHNLARQQLDELSTRFDPERLRPALSRLAGQLDELTDPSPAAMLESLLVDKGP